MASVSPRGRVPFRSTKSAPNSGPTDLLEPMEGLASSILAPESEPKLWIGNTEEKCNYNNGCNKAPFPTFSMIVLSSTPFRSICAVNFICQVEVCQGVERSISLQLLDSANGRSSTTRESRCRSANHVCRFRSSGAGACRTIVHSP